jgi:hypothetical protein
LLKKRKNRREKRKEKHRKPEKKDCIMQTEQVDEVKNPFELVEEEIQTNLILDQIPINGNEIAI